MSSCPANIHTKLHYIHEGRERQSEDVVKPHNIYKFQTHTDQLKTFRDIPLSEKTQKGW